MFINPRITVLTFIFVLGLTLTNCNQSGSSNNEVKNRASTVKRVGMVIRLNEDMIEEYKKLHADGNAGVRDLLTKYNMRNFNIFLHKLDDGNY